MLIRKARRSDISSLLKLHRAASLVENGIARTAKEISKKYIAEFVRNSLKKGLIFVAEINKEIVAEIHCYKFEPACFKHTFSNTTIVVHPDFIGKGIGRKIFSHLLEEIKSNRPDIARLELNVRQNNHGAIKLYESLGFEIEGILKNRILDAEKKISSDTQMAWLNPNFKN